MSTQNVKKAQQDEAAAEASKQRCKTCFKETAPNPKCFGHSGGGGGGGSSGGGSSSTSEDKRAQADTKSLSGSAQTSGHEGSIIISGSMEPSIDGSAQADFDPKIIAILINARVLTVDANREQKTISIKYDEDILDTKQLDEITKYISAIKNELAEFNKENPGAELDIKKVVSGPKVSYTIICPTVELYDKFIQRLADNLVPSPSPELEAEKNKKSGAASEYGGNHHLSPFNTEPSPYDGNIK